MAEVDCFGEDTPEAALAAKKLARANNMDKAWNRFVGTQHDQALTRYWYPTTNRMMTMGLDVNFLREMPQEISGASISPTNEIEQPKVISHDLRPWPLRTFQMTLGQSKQLRRQKQVAQAIIHNRFGMLIREKAAAKAFESTLAAILSAPRLG